MKKFLKTAALFVLGISLINLVINILVDYPVQDERYSVRYDYFNKNIDSYNTAFFGTSRTIRHVVPSVFDSVNKVHGIETRSFNFGTPANKLLETFYQYESFLKDYKAGKGQNIKYAFIEVTPMDAIEFQNVSKRKASYWFNAKYAGHVAGYLTEGAGKRSYGNYIYTFIIRYFGFNYLNNPVREKSKDSVMWLGPGVDGHVDYDYEVKHTADKKEKKKLTEFRQRFLDDPSGLLERRKDAEKQYAVESKGKANAELLKLMKDMLEKSRENGIELKFIIQARLGSYKEVHIMKAQLPEYFLDVSDPAKHPELWTEENSFDIGHMNKMGSAIFTRLLSEAFINDIKQ